MKVSTRHPRLSRLRYLDCEEVELTVELDPGLGTRTLYIRSDGGEYLLEMDLYTGDIIESKQIPSMVVESLHEWVTLGAVIPEVYLDDSKLEFGRGDGENTIAVRGDREGARCIIQVTVNGTIEARASLDLLSGSSATSGGPNRMLEVFKPDLFQAVSLANWAWGEWI